MPDGTIRGLRLDSQEQLSIRNASIPILIKDAFEIDANASLLFILNERDWGSTISFRDVDDVRIDGRVILSLETGASAESMFGRDYQLFNFAGLDLETQPFLTIDSTTGSVWDTSRLNSHVIAMKRAATIEIDELSAAILAGTTDQRWDFNRDGSIDSADRLHWIKEIRKTSVGDSNLDRVFDSDDLVHVFRAGQYEDDLVGNSVWATGDWNGDAEFSSADIVFAFQNGSYVNASTAVPSPNPAPHLLFWLIAWSCHGRAAWCRLTRKDTC